MPCTDLIFETMYTLYLTEIDSRKMQKINKCKSCNSKKLVTIYPLNGFNVVQCRDCGLRFRDIKFGYSESKALYNREYFTEEQADYFFKYQDIKVLDFSKRLDEIDKYRKNNNRLLDIGCAIGTFLNLAQIRGYDVFGFEPSNFAAEYARNNFNLTDIKNKFTENSFPDNYFDIVTMWDVVDHDENPLELLKVVYRKMKKGGKLFIQTNVEDSLLYRLAHILYAFSFGLIKYPIEKGYPIHHSNYYSTKTLRNDIELAGFSVIEEKRTPLDPALISLKKTSKIAFKLISTCAHIANSDFEIRFITEKV